MSRQLRNRDGHRVATTSGRFLQTFLFVFVLFRVLVCIWRSERAVDVLALHIFINREIVEIDVYFTYFFA